MQQYPDIQKVCDIALEAGEKILSIYHKEYKVSLKEDRSPLTEADLLSNEVILAGLKELTPEVPILSEESKEVPYEVRKDWEYFWLVDPIDGTKDFINKTGDFTVNIALVHTDLATGHGKPVAGVVYAPAHGRLYYGDKEGAFISEGGQTRKISPRTPGSVAHVVASRFHLSPETQGFVDNLKKEFQDVELVETGSSLKLCLVAEGRADFYPRFGPTMEWDTAAAHAVVLASGAHIEKAPEGGELVYNKENLLNPWFLVAATRR